MDAGRSQYIGILFVIALVFFVLELYFFNYNHFYDLGYGSDFFAVRAETLRNSTIFSNPIIARFFVILLVSITIVLSKVKMKLTEKKKRKSDLIPITLLIGLCYLFTNGIYTVLGNTNIAFLAVVILSFVSLLTYITYASQLYKLFYSNLMGDRFQKEGRKFDQFKPLLENEYSINIKTEDGWVNVVNPFRASQVLGTPGSGKSYSFLIEAIIQHIQKGYAMVLYDFKFPDLALIALNALKENHTAYEIQPQFCIINFDDLKRSNRCNPLQPDLLLDTTDATGASQALMYGLYPKWAQKQGEFFTESSINFVAACIWGLKQIQNGKYCTVPHLIQFIALDYDDMFKILSNLDDDYINNVIAPFISAWKQEATDQLEGQIGTTRIALSRLTSKYVYWVMNPDPSDPNNFSLQINDPKNPKILILSNNPDKKDVYSPLLSLYNTRVMRLINKKGQLKTAVIYDELPTLSFPPGSLDNLIATARSNKIAVWLGFQDFAQLTRDLGKEIAEAIINTVGNTFSGMVNFDTAEKLSKKFGKIKVKKESVNMAKESTSVNISTAMEELIPPSEISSLEQGVFVGQVADDRGYEIDQKIFYSKIIIDHEKRKTYEVGEIPEFVKFEKPIEESIQENFNKIKNEILELAKDYSTAIEEDQVSFNPEAHNLTEDN